MNQPMSDLEARRPEPAEVDTVAMVGRILDDAAWYMEDDDQYFALCLQLDPDGRISEELGDRDYTWDQARRAALSPEALAEEDARRQRMIDRGMEIVRRVMDERRSQP